MTLAAPSSSVGWTTPGLSIETEQMGPLPVFSQWSSASAWGTANRAIYVPVRVPRRVIIRELGFASANTGTGNVDVGVYDASGTRIVSSGSNAKSAASDLQIVEVADTTIGPGLYYLALNSSSTTDTFVTVTPTAPCAAGFGLLTEAVGALALPATATWAVDQTLAFCPLIAMLFVTEVA